MARYSIDGQILTDMADIIRDAKDYVIIELSMTSLGSNQNESTRSLNTTPALQKGHTYKMPWLSLQDDASCT